LLAIIDPLIEGILWIGGKQLPVAGIRTFVNKLGGATIAQGETGSIRVDPSASAVACGQTHAAFAGNINPV
jgi:hypothetical protein